MSWHTIVDGPKMGPHKSTTVYNRLVYERRKKLGLTQSQVARRAGISACYVAQLENSRSRTVRARAVQRVARVLGLKPSDIGIEENPHRRRENRQSQFTEGVFLSAVPIEDVAGRLECRSRVPGTDVGLRELRDVLQAMIFESPLANAPRAWFVLATRMGLGGNPPMTLEQVAAIMRVSRERVRMIEQRTLRTLMHPVRRERLLRLLGGDPCETMTSILGTGSSSPSQEFCAPAPARSGMGMCASTTTSTPDFRYVS